MLPEVDELNRTRFWHPVVLGVAASLVFAALVIGLLIADVGSAFDPGEIVIAALVMGSGGAVGSYIGWKVTGAYVKRRHR